VEPACERCHFSGLRLGAIHNSPFSILSNLIESSTDWTDLSVLMKSRTRLIDRDRMAICSAGDVHDMEWRIRDEYCKDLSVGVATKFTPHVARLTSGR
jgi:hypothetical protein